MTHALTVPTGEIGRALPRAETKRLVDMQYSIHIHVWTQNELLEMLVEIRRRYGLPFDIEAVIRNGDESLVALRKRHEPIPRPACPPRPKLAARLARLFK